MERTVKDLPTRAKEQTTSSGLYSTDSEVYACSKAKGSDDCDVFALAFATTLLYAC